MGFEVAWRTQAGTRTTDNRDYAGVGFRGETVLCVLLDGSSRGPESGALAKDIATGLIDWFTTTHTEITAEAIEGRLRQLHRSLSARWRRASASYGLVLLDGVGEGAAMLAGDCLLGRMANEATTWLSRPDTLANAFDELDIPAIAASPERHRLTRSFRRREFMPPSRLRLVRERDLILATDGFWADLNAVEQARFLAGDCISPAGADDQSVVHLRIQDVGEGAVRTHDDDAEALYVRIAEDRACRP